MTPGRILLFENSRSLAINMRLLPRMTALGTPGGIITLSPKRDALYRAAGLESCILDAVTHPADMVRRGAELSSRLESVFPDFRLDLAIKRDRFLNWRSYRGARNRLCAAIARFDVILDEEKPVLVVGEVSTALEYALSFLCEARGIPYRHLLNLPSATPRITLFDYAHTAQSTRYPGDSYDPKDASQFDVSYFDLGTRRAGGNQSRFTLWRDLLTATYSSHDYRTDLLYKGRYLIRMLYAPLYWLMEAFFAAPSAAAEGAVLLALHVQPESTPDYVSIYHADQLRLAMDIADGLPHGVQLLLKEHPQYLSVRNPLALFGLLCRRNVRLLRRAERVGPLLPRLDCLVTIAGTMAVEAVGTGTPTVIYSDAFLGGLPNVVDGRLFPSFAAAYTAARARRGQCLTEDEVDAFLKRLGTPGLIYDWVVMPEVLSDIYVDALAACMAHFVSLGRQDGGQRLPGDAAHASLAGV